MKPFLSVISSLVMQGQNRPRSGSRPFYGCKSVLSLHREIETKKSKYKPHQGARESARRKRQGLA